MGIFYFLIMIGVLVFVHELGHFLAAKLFDVKVLRFSIGFGPKFVGYTKGETEYVICALPLGGYVQMLGDMDETDHVDVLDRGRALHEKPIWQRSIVVLAGPLFNVILPVLLYFGLTMTASQVPPSLVGEIYDDMPAAQAGLQPGDRIVAIDGKPVDYWHQVLKYVSPRPGEEITLDFERDGQRKQVSLTPEVRQQTDFLGLNTGSYGLIGISVATHGTTLGIVDPEGAGAKAGLQTFDRILTINGNPVHRFHEVESAVRTSEGKPLDLVVLRRDPIPTDYAQFLIQSPIQLTAQPERDDQGIYSLGIDRVDMFVSRVDRESPAAQAGLQVGDQILSLNGRPYTGWSLMMRQIRNDGNQAIVDAQQAREDIPDSLSFDITWRRQGQILSGTLEARIVNLEKQNHYMTWVGWGHIVDSAAPEPVDFPLGRRIAYAATSSVSKTVEFTRMTTVGIMRLVQGRMSTSNIGGPIMIGEFAAMAGKAGIDRFIEMMAIISINLALINLLPIPVLDGGKLVLYLIEGIKRGPVSFRARQISAYVGFVMIVLLMILAFKNDIERNWDRIADWANISQAEDD